MKHSGGCHCGRVRFEADMDLKKAIVCNCSICSKRGSMFDFVPEAKFKVLAGKNELQEYLFNKHKIHHLFCKTCGILPFAKAVAPDGTKTVAVNVRCLDDVDLDSLEIQNYDGKSR